VVLDFFLEVRFIRCFLSEHAVAKDITDSAPDKCQQWIEQPKAARLDPGGRNDQLPVLRKPKHVQLFRCIEYWADQLSKTGGEHLRDMAKDFGGTIGRVGTDPVF